MPKKPAGKRLGRPPVLEGKSSTGPVTLLDAQIRFLDGICRAIRTKHDASMSRAAIIRALIEALRESGLDLSEVVSEKDLRDLVLARLTR